MFTYFCIAAVIVFLTRAAAYYAAALLPSGDIPMIQGVLYLRYVENRGAAFGIFQNEKVFLIGISALIFLLITVYVFKKRNELRISFLAPLALIAGGGVSNMADRLQFGYVVDYIDVRIISYPVFNLADICVVIGVIWLGWKMLFSKQFKG